jgi:hypothetical protein
MSAKWESIIETIEDVVETPIWKTMQPSITESCSEVVDDACNDDLLMSIEASTWHQVRRPMLFDIVARFSKWTSGPHLYEVE